MEKGYVLTDGLEGVKSVEICAKLPIEEAKSASQENVENRMIIIGLDVSLRNTGYCVAYVNIECAAGGVFKPSLEGDFLRKLEISKLVKNVVVDSPYATPPDFKIYAFIEGYSFGSQHRGQSLAELTGLIKKILYEEEIVTYIVPPTVLKKFITGKGNSDKNIMLLKIYKRYGREFTDDNEADAFALAKLGEELLKNLNHELWKKVELLC